jgi:alpha-methylacyl-CoA racemase
MHRGPLAGIKVVEIASIGPVPLACTLLSDMGAEVTRVDRPKSVRGLRLAPPDSDVLSRGRTSNPLDLKSSAGVAGLIELVDRSDVLIEGLRPGVIERLGVGPKVCLERNERLIYARATGWGQTGPLRDRAGHDINYIGVTGVLQAMGRANQPPSPPLNLIADYGGGAMLTAFGIAAALFERERSGRGQVIDAAMVDGVAFMSAIFHSMIAAEIWSIEREANFLDGSAHYYAVYETADRRFLTVGAIEPQFYAEFLERMELAPSDWPQHDRSRRPELKAKLAAIVRERPLDHWSRTFEGSDACVARVNTFIEAHTDPHLSARGTFVKSFGITQHQRHDLAEPRGELPAHPHLANSKLGSATSKPMGQDLGPGCCLLFRPATPRSQIRNQSLACLDYMLLEQTLRLLAVLVAQRLEDRTVIPGGALQPTTYIWVGAPRHVPTGGQDEAMQG